MRENIIIGKFAELDRTIQTLAYHMQLGFSGNVLHEDALKSLLMKKGIITETEFKEELGEQIKKANNAQAEKAKTAQEDDSKTLITPTNEETTKIDASKAENKEK